MNRTIWIRLVCVLFILGGFTSIGWAEVLVQENFEGGVFPPTGWTVSSTLMPFCTWVSGESSGNHFASCSILSMREGDACLNTPEINLSAGQTINIAFDSRVSYLVSGMNVVSLYHDSSLVWSTNPTKKKPYHNSFTLPVITTSGDYYVRWTLHNPIGMSSYQVDNVVISVSERSNQTQIQSTSVGMIKSTFR